MKLVPVFWKIRARPVLLIFSSAIFPQLACVWATWLTCFNGLTSLNNASFCLGVNSPQISTMVKAGAISSRDEIFLEGSLCNKCFAASEWCMNPWPPDCGQLAGVYYCVVGPHIPVCYLPCQMPGTSSINQEHGHTSVWNDIIICNFSCGWLLRLGA